MILPGISLVQKIIAGAMVLGIATLSIQLYRSNSALSELRHQNLLDERARQQAVEDQRELYRTHERQLSIRTRDVDTKTQARIAQERTAASAAADARNNLERMLDAIRTAPPVAETSGDASAARCADLERSTRTLAGLLAESSKLLDEGTSRGSDLAIQAEGLIEYAAICESVGRLSGPK